MTHVCTLVAARSSGAVTPDLIAAVREHLPSLTKEESLSSGVAHDLYFNLGDDDSTGGLADTVRHALADEPVDIAIQAVDGRKKRLFLADMDSTMIEQECIDELADKVGIKDKVAAITERAMNGELDFEEALKERVGLLQGLSAGAIEQVYDTRISFSPGARELIATMNRVGIQCVLVSGGFTQFTARVAAALGFASHHANELRIDQGMLDGTVSEPILGRDAKLTQLKAHANALGVPTKQVIAIGDGANDLAMIKAAGLGIAYRAKPTVRRQADVQLNHADLTAVLFMQGFRQADIVGA